MGSEALVHVFLVSFPGQGHVNPLLRLGKRLAAKGLLVTFSTPESIGKQMRKVSTPFVLSDAYIQTYTLAIYEALHFPLLNCLYSDTQDQRYKSTTSMTGHSL